MYLIIKTAQRKTKDHYSVPFDGESNFINKGEKYLKLSNGTIGAGARAVNISKPDAIKMLEEALEELRYEEYYDDEPLSMNAICSVCGADNLIGTDCLIYGCGNCGKVNNRGDL